MAALRAKSLALTDTFIALVEARCPGRFTLMTPRAHAQRGSQVCLAMAEAAEAEANAAYAIVQVLATGEWQRPESNIRNAVT
jgi:kynureninase